jgi:hypothetical protein
MGMRRNVCASPEDLFAMLRSVLLLPLLALGACAVATSRSNVVVVTENATVVAGCTRLGPIDGSSPLREIQLRDQARDSALARLKIAGADLGATHVHSSVGDIKWKGPDMSGIAYKCAR